MPYEVLARKWRPQVFEDVIGQEHIAQTLINAVKTGRVAHAYLFGGPRGVGKTSAARILAKAINCDQGDPGIPCNKCQSCLEITNGSSVDVQEIDGASNRGIGEIRELRENVKYMPSSSKYRIYIIDEVHMLTLPAFNALLKTLEEPPAHVKFIFATTESHKVPVTILSRCQRFDFKRIAPGQIIVHLEKIAKKEHIKISKSGLALIARQAEGSMRDAESLLDQVASFTGPEVEDRHITEILGIIDSHIIFETSRAIIEGSPVKCLEIIDQIYTYGHDIKEFYTALMDQFRNLLIALVAPQENLLDMNESEKEEVRRQAEQAGLEKLQIMLNFLINREQDLRFASHPRLVMETTMIKLCHLGEFLSFGELLQKIEALEKRLTGVSIANQQPETHHVSEEKSPGPDPATAAEPRTDYVSDPGPKQAYGNQEQAHMEQNEAPQQGQSWDGFLTFLSSRNKPMFKVLKDWQVLNMAEGTLEIAKSNQSFSSSYFDDNERQSKLSDYCRDFFQRDLRIKIVANNQAPPKKEPLSKAKAPEPKSIEHPDLPPPVQDILHMFQGEIKQGPSAKKAGPHNPEKGKRKEEEKR